MRADTSVRMPTYFLSHGGGPWPWLAGPMRDNMAELEKSLQRLPHELPAAPTAILMISGHWEAPTFTVQTNPNPPMVYDYGGFPEHTYRITYPAPGSPALAARVVELLRAAAISVAEDPARGYDHGMFAPLAVAWPDADVPVVQLSMQRGYDPEAHLAVGRALAPLRDEGVLILGSGLSYHNLGLMGRAAAAPSRAVATDRSPAGPVRCGHRTRRAWTSGSAGTGPTRRDTAHARHQCRGPRRQPHRISTHASKPKTCHHPVP